MKLKPTMLSIAAFLIISLLGINAYFAKDLVNDLKAEDKINEDKIEAVESKSIDKIEKVNDKFTVKFEKLEKQVSENKSDVALINKDIQYIKEAVDYIKDEVSKK